MSLRLSGVMPITNLSTEHISLFYLYSENIETSIQGKM
ncbi:MAG: hypothetical protein MRECE_62c001 [Mycoplasmataceae bacterium CE_OT135]|nr:MAG: hypothetical protein MRECE_62c001 [Mycoplasmataceae bacterium CE_OT135]